MSNSADSPSLALSVPEIPEYEFSRGGKLGEGTFGEVWYGLYKEDQPRAVKIFKPGMIEGDLWRSEYEKLKALDEPPGIVTLYDRGETADGRPFVAMRLMAEKAPDGQWRGRTLMERIAADDLDEEARWQLIFEVAEVLAYMHRQKVYHCDIKPGNILLSAGGEPRPVLCDFGQSVGDGYSPEKATGTFLYASPEQLRREEKKIAAWDVYSFGVTAWQLLTGRLPRLNEIWEKAKGGDAATLLEATIDSLSSFNASIGESLDRELLPKVMAEAIIAERELELPKVAGVDADRKEEWQVILQCLALKGDPVPRFADMGAVVKAFEEVSERRAVAGERRKKTVFAILTCFGLVTTAFAGWQWAAAAKAQGEAERSGERAAEAAVEQKRLAEVAAAKRDEAEKLQAIAEEQGEAARTQKQIAEKEKIKAVESEKTALLGRATAEKLINSMLYDLKNELEPLGRVDLLDNVSEEAASYFAALPETQRSEASERERSTMLNNRGEVFLAKGEFGKASQAFEESMEIRKALLGLSPDDESRRRDVSVSLERLGDADGALENYEAARQHLSESLKIRIELNEDEGNLATARDVSVSASKLGGIYLILDQPAKAAEMADRSIALLEPYLVEIPSDAGLKRDYAAILMRRGDISQRMGEGEKAKETYDESLRLIREVMENSRADDRSIRSDYVAILFRLGEWLAGAGRTGEAADFFERALPVARQLKLSEPGNAKHLRGLALLTSQLGQLRLDDEDLKEAEALLDESVEAFGILTERAVVRSDWLEESQLALIARGDVSAENEKWAEADEFYSRSLSIARKRIEVGEENTGELRQDLIVSLYKSSSAKRKSGNLTERGLALEQLKRASELLKTSEADDAEGWLSTIEGEIKRW